MKLIRASMLLIFTALACFQIYCVTAFSGKWMYNGFHPFLYLFLVWLAVLWVHRLIGGLRIVPVLLVISIYGNVGCLIVLLGIQNEFWYRLIGLCPPLLIMVQCVVGLIDFGRGSRGHEKEG